MNEYEIMLLLDPELGDERGTEIIQRVRETAEAGGGSWDGHEPWGRRRLAFEIDHKNEAVYHLLLFTCDAEALAEIVRVLKITDGVMRHGAFRRVKNGHLKPPSQIPTPSESPREERDSRPARAAAPAAAASESSDDTGGDAE